MPIFYSLIARNNETILVEANTSSGNYPQVTMKYLKSNKSGDGYKTFANQDYVYYLFNERPYTYLCLCEAGFSKVKCLTYLKDIRDRFVQTFAEDERDTSVTFGLGRFEPQMKERMRYYNESSEQDGRLKGLVNQLQDVQEVMQQNMDNIVERGQKIEILRETTKNMKNEAIVLHTRARRLKNQKRCENLWKKIVICILFWVVIYGVLCLVCGGFALSSCFGSS